MKKRLRVVAFIMIITMLIGFTGGGQGRAAGGNGFTIPVPAASGTSVKKNSKAEIDVSNTGNGYVMIKYLQKTSKKVKVIIKGPGGTSYTYNLSTNGDYEVFPLTDGDGSYSIGVYENISGNQYSTAHSTTTTVAIKDKFAPFLTPSQYVNYNKDSATVKKAAELVEGVGDTMEQISAIYNYAVTNFTYDKELAATVQSGYIPDVDTVLAAKKGICFDYAAVVTAMLRSQGIPTKLVVGYTGSIYHAWINTWSEESGWVNSVIYFDGKSWKLMDPTFASSNNQSAAIMKYIGNGDNYTAKYQY